MKIRCIHTKYSEINPPLNPEKYNYLSRVALTLDKEYVVYAIMADEEANVKYLILDDDYILYNRNLRYPAFHNSSFFEITDHLLPYEEWHFGIGTGDYNHIKAILGYKLIVKDQKHFEGILLHDDYHVALFEKWRESIDQQYIE